MPQFSPNASILEQANLLPEVLERLAACTPPHSLERAELVARLTKLLERFDEGDDSTIMSEHGSRTS